MKNNIYTGVLSYKKDGEESTVKCIFKVEIDKLHKYNKDTNSFDKLLVTQVYDAVTGTTLLKTENKKPVYRYSSANFMVLDITDLEKQKLNNFEDLVGILNYLNNKDNTLKLSHK